MPTRYYFNLVSGEATIPDDTGAEAATLSDAKVQAWQFAFELRQEYDAVIEDWGLWQLDIARLLCACAAAGVALGVDPHPRKPRRARHPEVYAQNLLGFVA
jgi:hypothetical protein